MLPGGGEQVTTARQGSAKGQGAHSRTHPRSNVPLPPHLWALSPTGTGPPGLRALAKDQDVLPVPWLAPHPAGAAPRVGSAAAGAGTGARSRRRLQGSSSQTCSCCTAPASSRLRFRVFLSVVEAPRLLWLLPPARPVPEAEAAQGVLDVSRRIQRGQAATTTGAEGSFCSTLWFGSKGCCQPSVLAFPTGGTWGKHQRAEPGRPREPRVLSRASRSSAGASRFPGHTAGTTPFPIPKPPANGPGHTNDVPPSM